MWRLSTKRMTTIYLKNMTVKCVNSKQVNKQHRVILFLRTAQSKKCCQRWRVFHSYDLFCVRHYRIGKQEKVRTNIVPFSLYSSSSLLHSLGARSQEIVFRCRWYSIDFRFSTENKNMNAQYLQENGKKKSINKKLGKSPLSAPLFSYSFSSSTLSLCARLYTQHLLMIFHNLFNTPARIWFGQKIKACDKHIVDRQSTLGPWTWKNCHYAEH